MSRRLTTLFVFLLSGALLSAPAQSQSGRSWLNGFVFAESETHELRDATVELRGAADYERLRDVHLTARPDESGAYSLTDVPYGMYVFRVSAPGFRDYEIPLYVAPDMLTQIHVRLLPTAPAR